MNKQNKMWVSRENYREGPAPRTGRRWWRAAGGSWAHARHGSPCMLCDRETCCHEKSPDSGSLMGAPLWPGASGGLCPCPRHLADPCGLLSGVQVHPASEHASATPRERGTGPRGGVSLRCCGRGRPGREQVACHVQPSGTSERGSGPRGPYLGGGIGPSLTRAFQKLQLSRDQSPASWRHHPRLGLGSLP